MTLRLNRQDLVDLINSMEEGGQDASHLRAVLATLPVPESKQGPRSGQEEELTTAEYLNMRVGDLFPSGITDEILAQLIEIDRSYSIKDLKEICREAGLSVHGTKKELAAKLLASGQVKDMKVLIEKEIPEEVQVEEYILEESIDLHKQKEWFGKPGALAVPKAYITPLRYEIVVFARKERGGSDFTFRCREYQLVDERAWRFTGVMIDTSIKGPKGEVEMVRLTYHPEVMLVNIGFLVIPATEDAGTRER